MSLELIKSSARLFGGSAVAGMGFSFGRDIYRGATKKDTKNAILGFLLIALAVIGTYTGGVWLARNYQTIWGSIFKRIGSLFILAPSFAFLLFLGVMFTGVSSNSKQKERDSSGTSKHFSIDPNTSNHPTVIRLQSTDASISEINLRWNNTIPSMNMTEVNGGEGWVEGTKVNDSIWEFTQNKFYSLKLDFFRRVFSETGFDGSWLPEVTGGWTAVSASPVEDAVQSAPLSADPPSDSTVDDNESADNAFNYAALILPCSVLAIGFLVGFFQRSKRRLVWEAEAANALFMQQHGIVEHEDSTLEDTSTGQNYRIEHMGKQRITLFPIGRRGKRAYINITPDGKYAEFTGMIKV